MIQHSDTQLSVSQEHLATTIKALRQVLPAAHLRGRLAELSASVQQIGQHRLPLPVMDELLQDHHPLTLVRAYSRLDYTAALLRKTFLSSAPTRRDALKLLCRYFKVNTQGVALALHDQAHGCVLQITSTCQQATADAQRDAVTYGLVRTLHGLGITDLHEVSLGLHAGVELTDYAALFPVPVVAGAKGQAHIHIAHAVLDQPLGWPSCSVERIAKRERQLLRLDPQADWGEAVNALLPLLCRDNRVDIDQCAALLAVSRRSLQRHIQRSGAGFRDLVERSRRDQASQYLAQPYSLQEVAELLGYRQSAQFYRAFRQWFGCSPADYRQHAITLSQRSSSWPASPDIEIPI